MEVPLIAQTLQRLPHFRSLNADTLAEIAKCCRVRTLQAGETIFREGQRVSAFYIVRSGGVRLYRISSSGREQALHHKGPNQSFAEAALFSFGFFPAYASATESPTELIEVQGKSFLELFRSSDTLAGAMVGSLCQHLSSLVERVDELTTLQAGARLASHLLRIPMEATDGHLRIELPMSKKDLAAHLSMTPETLSRLLRQWRDKGILESAGSTLRLLEVGALEALADPD